MKRIAYAGFALLVLAAMTPALAAKGGKGGGRPGGGGEEPPTPAAPEIAYFLSKGDKVMVMDADGSNPTLVVRRVSGITVQPSWSPDGQYVIFHATTSGSGVYVAALAGGSTTKLTPTATQYLNRPVWSPVATADGSFKILFEDQAANGSRDLFLMNTDGTGRVNLTDTADFDEEYPTWSPDAAQIGAVVSFTDENGVWGSDVRVYDLDLNTAGNALELGTGLDITDGTDIGRGDLAFLDWSRRTQELAVSCYDPADGHWDIWTLGDDGQGTPSNLTRTPDASERHPTWSPDDSQIAYQYTGSGTAGVYVISASGGTPIALESDALAPDWRR